MSYHQRDKESTSTGAPTGQNTEESEEDKAHTNRANRDAEKEYSTGEGSYSEYANGMS